MTMIPYLCLMLAMLLPGVMGGECQQPRGQEGDSLTTGCILLTCKGGVWRPSMDPRLCCYNGEAFQLGSTITTVSTADNCITTSLECGEEGVKTRIERGCSGPATAEQVRGVKCLLKEHFADSGNSGCSDQSLAQEKESSTSYLKTKSGILITGGEGQEAMTTELFIVKTKQVCSLPSLPSPRFGHTLDVVSDMPVVCGGHHLKIGDDDLEQSCQMFSPLSDCGAWHNLTTLQYKYGFSYHTSWVSQHGLVLFQSGGYNVMEMLPVADPAKPQYLEFDHSKELMQIGSGACGFGDGDTFILTGHGYLGHSKSVSRFYLEMFDKPGHCSWSDNEYCCMWGQSEDYERCKLVKGRVEKLPDLQQTRGEHSCGMYFDKNDTKVYIVAGGWDAYVHKLSSAEVLVEGDSEWRYVTPLPRKLSHAASVSLDNQIFIIGGWFDYKEASDEILTYDEDQMDWVKVGQLQTKRADLAATTIDASKLMGFC